MTTNKKILICDDDEGILEMLEIVLEGGGYNAISVQNSLNVYELIAQENPDLLLLDLWMPVLSGDQILKSLRQNPQTKALPIVVISASQDGKHIANDAGANDFIAKPFDVDSLLQTIERQFH